MRALTASQWRLLRAFPETGVHCVGELARRDGCRYPLNTALVLQRRGYLKPGRGASPYTFRLTPAGRVKRFRITTPTTEAPNG